jgi:predicted permease
MHFFNDQLRHVTRRLVAAPLFTVVALLTLAIGIGANTAIFSVVKGVLLKPLPYDEPDRLVGVWHTAPGFGFDVLNSGPATYFTYLEEGRSFEESGLYTGGSVTITGLAEPERVDVLRVTYGVLPALRVRPVVGRTFNVRDDSPGTPETVVLSYAYWQRKFAGDPQAVGRRLMVDGAARDIIGVLPQSFRFRDDHPAVLLPLRFDRAKIFVGDFSYEGIARLKPGVTLAQANADVARMLPIMADKFPPPPGFKREVFLQARMGPRLHLFKEDVVGDVGKVLWVLMAAVGIVLFIACANVANLFLVRAEGRQQELAIRAALGAGWAKLARELLFESVALGILGGLLGLGLAFAGIDLLVWLAPANIPRLDDISIDPVVLLFTLGISILAGVLFGCIPVFKYAAAPVGTLLREGGRALSAGKGRLRARNVLVVVQVALALVLLISSGLMIRTFQALRKVYPGFTRPEQVLTLHISIPEGQVADAESVTRMHQQIGERIQQIPGVASVGLSSSITLDGNINNNPIFIEDFPTPSGQIPPMRRFKFISPGFSQTMGNRLVAGRDLTWADVYGDPTVLLISENLARKYWRDPARAVGRRVRETPQARWRQIVGVVGDIRDNGVDQPAPEAVYLPMLMKEWWGIPMMVQRNMAYAIRSPRTGTLSFLKEIREAVWSVNGNLPVADVRTLKQIYRQSMARTSFTLLLLALASAMALLLGVIGIYGVISYSVSQRTREIGIRMALGAREQNVSRMFVSHGLRLVAIGIAIGVGAAAGLTRLLRTLLFEVSPLDPLTFTAVSIGLVVVALLASYLPARRATAVDPVQALKFE